MSVDPHIHRDTPVRVAGVCEGDPSREERGQFQVNNMSIFLRKARQLLAKIAKSTLPVLLIWCQWCGGVTQQRMEGCVLANKLYWRNITYILVTHKPNPYLYGLSYRITTQYHTYTHTRTHPNTILKSNV